MNDVHDQSIPIPAATRVSHPPFDRTSGVRAADEDVSDSMNILVQDDDLIRGLHYLKRIRHVGDARNARQETSRFRVRRSVVLKVFLLLLSRPRLVRDFITFNDSLTG